MKTSDVYSLNEGEMIIHKHYGVCFCTGMVPQFGPLLVPATEAGRELLKKHTDTVALFKNCPLGTPLLENHFRLIMQKVLSDCDLYQEVHQCTHVKNGGTCPDCDPKKSGSKCKKRRKGESKI